MFEQNMQQGLMQAVPFTAEELNMNRSGTVSEAQRARLGKQAGGTQAAALVMFVVFILIIAGIFAYLFVFTHTGDSLLKMFTQDPSTLPIVGGVLGVVALIIFGSFLRTLLRTSDLRSGKISVAEGKARVKTTRMTVGYVATVATGYELIVGRVKFYVARGVLDNIIEGAKYRIYYVKNYPMHAVLSLEEVKA
ncbi:MAG TPA: hypothetical protein VKQ72_18520 [Aggregatilineales bacterium]|nr:hypothetical protein [Aggregatilineales bacterium]